MVQNVQIVQPLPFEFPQGHELVEWRSVQSVTGAAGPVGKAVYDTTWSERVLIN